MGGALGVVVQWTTNAEPRFVQNMGVRVKSCPYAVI